MRRVFDSYNAGKVRQTHYNLPLEEHTYGKKIPADPEPIHHGTPLLMSVTNSWNYGQQSYPKSMQNTKDFRQMNKMTVKSGMHTAKVHRQRLSNKRSFE
jgi:hypothetical protein